MGSMGPGGVDHPKVRPAEVNYGSCAWIACKGPELPEANQQKNGLDICKPRPSLDDPAK